MYGQGKTRGQAAMLRVPATVNQACFAILPSDALDPDFLCYWFRHKYVDMRRLSEGRGGNQANLNGEVLRRIRLPLLHRSQQQIIATRLKQALEGASRIQAKASELIEQLQLLPSRLLTEAFG